MQYMIQQLQYNTHLILNSKYRLIIHFFIISLIYLSLYGSKIIFCSNEGSDIPLKAEGKDEPYRGLTAKGREYKDQADAYIKLYNQKIIENTAQSIEIKNIETQLTETQERLQIIEQDNQRLRSYPQVNIEESCDLALRAVTNIETHFPRRTCWDFLCSCFRSHNETRDMTHDLRSALHDLHLSLSNSEAFRYNASVEIDRMRVIDEEKTRLVEHLRNEISDREEQIRNLRQRNIELQNTIPIGSRTTQRPITPLNPTDEEVKSMKEELFSITRERKK